MPSLGDLSSVFNQAPPSGFTLAGLGLQGDLSAQEAQIGQKRATRNFSKRYLPDLVGNQAARGAYNSSATVTKVRRGTKDYLDTLSDLASQGARGQSQLAVNALLAQTGIQV